MPADVVAWAGSIAEHPERWVALWLDGELGGVPFAEAYGRDRRAIRAFGDFESHRRAYLAVMRARAGLRGHVRASLTYIVSHRSKRSGYFGA